MDAHKCDKYLNARGELIDPAEQGGIGCRICLPPGGLLPNRKDKAHRIARALIVAHREES